MFEGFLFDRTNLSFDLLLMFIMVSYHYHFLNRLDEEASSNLEALLNAKEKIISELHYELHSIEGTLATEREGHLSEVKRLNALVNEKVSEALVFNYLGMQVQIHASSPM